MTIEKIEEIAKALCGLTLGEWECVKKYVDEAGLELRLTDVAQLKTSLGYEKLQKRDEMRRRREASGISKFTYES